LNVENWITVIIQSIMHWQLGSIEISIPGLVHTTVYQHTVAKKTTFAESLDGIVTVPKLYQAEHKNKINFY
jgi:hypothetical protein